MQFGRRITRIFTVATLMLATLGISATQASAETWQTCPNSATGYPCTATLDVVNARTQSNTNSTILYQYQAHQWITIQCFAYGDNINGDNIWYWSHPEGGPLPWAYVTGYLLDTGHDPHPGVRQC